MEGTKEASACLRTISTRCQIQTTPCRRKSRSKKASADDFRGQRYENFSILQSFWIIFRNFAPVFYNNKVNNPFFIKYEDKTFDIGGMWVDDHHFMSHTEDRSLFPGTR